MVKRSERGARRKRWSIYFAWDAKSNTTLQDVVDGGYRRIAVRNVSTCKLELIWPTAVTIDSAKRLLNIAKQKQESFNTLGEPRALDDDEADEASPADGLEPAAASAPMPEPRATPASSSGAPGGPPIQPTALSTPVRPELAL